jgi:hypothetical protein
MQRDPELYLQVEISTWQYNFLLRSADDGDVGPAVATQPFMPASALHV